jgi:hypothetical protein
VGDAWMSGTDVNKIFKELGRVTGRLDMIVDDVRDIKQGQNKVMTDGCPTGVENLHRIQRLEKNGNGKKQTLKLPGGIVFENFSTWNIIKILVALLIAGSVWYSHANSSKKFAEVKEMVENGNGATHE